MSNDILIDPEGTCQTYSPQYQNEKLRLEGDIANAIATGINRFKAQSGFSIAELSVEVRMNQTQDHGGVPETIVGQIQVNTVILEG